MRLITIDADELQQRFEGWYGGTTDQAADLIASLEGVKVQAGWQPQAIEWLRAKADKQEATNKECPAHAQAYPSWTERVVWWRSAADDLARECAAPAQPLQPAPEEPDMRAVCAALGFDPTNHHNAAKCPYCRPAAPSASGDALNATREPSDTQMLDWLEQAYTEGGAHPKPWREFMTYVAEKGFRAAIDAQITKEADHG